MNEAIQILHKMRAEERERAVEDGPEVNLIRFFEVLPEGGGIPRVTDMSLPANEGDWRVFHGLPRCGETQ